MEIEMGFFLIFQKDNNDFFCLADIKREVVVMAPYG